MVFVFFATVVEANSGCFFFSCKQVLLMGEFYCLTFSLCGTGSFASEPYTFVLCVVLACEYATVAKELFAGGEGIAHPAFPFRIPIHLKRGDHVREFGFGTFCRSSSSYLLFFSPHKMVVILRFEILLKSWLVVIPIFP